MRTHRTHEVLAPWSVGTPVLDAARLAVVRVEPVIRQRRSVFAIDLYLSDGAGATVIPTIFADPAVVMARDRDPLIFPAGTPGDAAFADALAGRVVPLLEDLILRAATAEEHVIRLADAPAFAAARAAGCFGAAPARESLARLAPYAYAVRFARGRSVRIDAPDAVGGWAYLRTTALAGVADARADAAAVAWYGKPPPPAADAEIAIVDADGDPGAATCIVRLDAEHGVPVIDPLPFDGAFTFDPAEGPALRRFSVERPPQPAAASDVPGFAPAGGSAGRIAVIVARADAAARPSADTDEARALVAGLTAEGFDAYAAAGIGDLAGADLVHVMGTRDGRLARAAVDAARRAGVPVAVHAYEEAAETGGWWGATVARYCFEYGSDDGEITAFLRMLVQRQVSAGPVGADAPYAPPDASLDDVASALRDADVVFVATAAEADAVLVRSGRRGRTAVVPPLAPVDRPVPVGDLVGADPFALVHAPIGPIGNQLLIARAAADGGIPLIAIGPVDDASYLERVREFGGRRLTIVTGEPPPEIAAGLRAAAAVVVDGAWVGDGASRVTAAVLAGAHAAHADRRRLPAALPHCHAFDPADLTGLSRALGAAWDAALRTGRRTPPDEARELGPAAALRAIVRGYAGVETPVT